MKSVKLLTLSLMLAFLAFSLHAQEKKILTFEQIFKNAEPKLTKELPNIIGWADDDHSLEMKKFLAGARATAHFGGHRIADI